VRISYLDKPARRPLTDAPKGTDHETQDCSQPLRASHAPLAPFTPQAPLAPPAPDSNRPQAPDPHAELSNLESQISAPPSAPHPAADPIHYPHSAIGNPINPQSEIPNPQSDLPALADSAERAVLTRLTALCSDAETSPELFCKLAHVFCEIKKENNVHEKTAALLEIGRDKTAAMLELAKAKARRRPARGPDDRSCENPFSHPTDAPAPYGRKSDDSPYTADEFHSALDAAVADIYGLSTPDENRPAPLGSPDDTAEPDPESVTSNPPLTGAAPASHVRHPQSETPSCESWRNRLVAGPSPSALPRPPP
jgi:hypothetical protein